MSGLAGSRNAERDSERRAAPLGQSVQDLPPALQRILSRPEGKSRSVVFSMRPISGLRSKPLRCERHRDRRASPGGRAHPMDLDRRASGRRGGCRALFMWRRHPGAVTVVEAVTRLTSDGEVKANSRRLETDGRAFTSAKGYRIMQVPATGRPAAIIPTRLPCAGECGRLSYDSSTCSEQSSRSRSHGR
jgi:hypothetical protein